MKQQPSDLDFFNERGFGRVIGFGTSPAILSIDFMVGFTDPKMPLGSDLDAQIAAAQQLYASARTGSVPIFHTVVRYDEQDLADAGIWALKQAGAASLRTGTPAVELDPRVGHRAGEQILVKKYASAFFGTDLTSRLTSAGIDTLLIVGCTTSGCVRASAVDAVQYGFRPMVIDEAVGDRSAAAHAQALFDLHQKYADVVTLADAITYLTGR